MTITHLMILYAGDLALDVAEKIIEKKPAEVAITLHMQNASEKVKDLLELGPDVGVCFVLQTIENASPTEDGGVCLRFFKRKTHPETLLDGKFQYTILGLGDSNLLLDRQTTTAKDCNQFAEELDARLAKLSARKFYHVGLADERCGLDDDVESWIRGFWTFFSKPT